MTPPEPKPRDDKFVGGKDEADVIVAAIGRGTKPEAGDDGPEVEIAGGSEYIGG